MRYLCDGIRVVQERDGANTPMVSYTRGKGLSGSLEGAGGIGGLLARSSGYSGGSWTAHNFYHADGLGNVTRMINSTATVVATYKYDPYGRTLSSSGSLAAANLYRFSSKEIHANSGMYYYGFRFYEPSLQRWINRDPLGERGGLNPYRFVYNMPVEYVDKDGLDIWIEGPSGKEPSLHQSICVGNPYGKYDSYSFGVNGEGLRAEKSCWNPVWIPERGQPSNPR